MTGSEAADYDEEFFNQLTAEKLRKVITRGYMKLQWVKERERNEALDLAVYNAAAAKVLKLDRWSDDRWDKEIARLEKPSEVTVSRRRGFQIAGKIG